MAYNWGEIKAEREMGKSIKSLAEKYGDYKVGSKKFKSVYAYFRKKLKDVEVGGETKRIISSSIKEKLEHNAKMKKIPELFEREVDLRVEYAEMNKVIKAGLMQELSKGKKASTGKIKQLKMATETIEKLRKNDWEVHEIQEVAKKIENEVKDITGDIDFSDISNEDLLEIANMEDVEDAKVVEDKGETAEDSD